MWWRWRKVRPANIPADLRDELERYGELAVATALARGFDVPTSPMFTLVRDRRDDTLAWLTERRDIAERKEQRLETVEWAILIFLIVGVTVDVLLLFHDK